jgi:hypothetical protein
MMFYDLLGELFGKSDGALSNKESLYRRVDVVVQYINEV